MANKYVDLAVLNLGLKKMATSVANNFSFKKDTIKKIEIKDAIPTGASAGATPEKCLIITYNDNGLLDKNGNPVNHVINLSIAELGTNISEWVSGTDYKVGSMVVHQQHIYKCKTSPQADNTVFDKAEWLILGIDDREKSLLDSLKIEEIKDDPVDLNKITGYKILFKGIKESDGSVGVDSELLQVKDLIPKFVDDTISSTDPKASEKLLSARKVLDLIAIATGTDMSLYAQRDEIYYTHTTYTRCLSTDDNALEVVNTVTDSSTEVAYDDVVLVIPDIVVGEFVVPGIAYDNPLFLQLESQLYKDILSQFTIETLKEDISDPDLITGYILKYRGKKIITETDIEDSIIDFETLIK